MAFGIDRQELLNWKRKVENGQIAILTHYWLDKRFPNSTSVTKVGCSDISILIEWGHQYNLNPNWIHQSRYPHFDLFGTRQRYVLLQEGLQSHIDRFNI